MKSLTISVVFFAVHHAPKTVSFAFIYVTGNKKKNPKIEFNKNKRDKISIIILLVHLDWLKHID